MQISDFTTHPILYMLRFIEKLFGFSLILLLISSVASAQDPLSKRIALVIGVKSYQYVQPLQNSLNDALDMSAVLKSKGFQVIELYDPKTKREMQDAIRKYFTLLQNQKNAAGLVYYSGHGMQVDGANYLIPSQADPQIKADLDDQCLNMDYVMQAIEQAGNDLNIFILDACRNNPFRSFSRSTEKGLSMVNTPKGSYIVYATKPGSVASDGTGKNGLFTSRLLNYMNTEGLSLEQVFKRVAADVAKQSNDSQRPWIASDYTGDFYFTQPKAEIASDKKNVASPELVKADPSKSSTLNGEADFLRKENNNFFRDMMEKEKVSRLSLVAPSPRAIIYSDLGFTEVSVDYSRILRRDRQIFGEGSNYMGPFGKIWRTGANQGTRIYFSKDVIIDQKLVEKGGYTIFSWPGVSSWEIALYKDLSIGGNTSAYNQNLEAIKVKVLPKTSNDFINTLTVQILKESATKGIIWLGFEKTVVEFSFTGISAQHISSTESRTLYQKVGASEFSINYTNRAIESEENERTIGLIVLKDPSTIANKLYNPGNYLIGYSSVDNVIYFGDKTNPIPVQSVYLKNWLANDIQFNVHELVVDDKTAMLEIMVGKNYYSLPIKVNYDNRINSMINETVNNSPTGGESLAIATYYLNTKQNLDKALEYVKISVASNPTGYWIIYTQAKIEFEIGAYQSALKSAESSMVESRKANNADYTLLNEKLITQIKSKL